MLSSLTQNQKHARAHEKNKWNLIENVKATENNARTTGAIISRTLRKPTNF